MGLSDGKIIDTKIWNIVQFILGLDVRIELGNLDVSFNGSNDNNTEGLLLGNSLGSTYVIVLVYAEGIKLGSNYSKWIDTVLGYSYEITLGFYVGTELRSIDG